MLNILFGIMIGYWLCLTINSKAINVHSQLNLLDKVFKKKHDEEDL